MLANFSSTMANFKLRAYITECRVGKRCTPEAPKSRWGQGQGTMGCLCCSGLSGTLPTLPPVLLEPLESMICYGLLPCHLNCSFHSFTQQLLNNSYSVMLGFGDKMMKSTSTVSIFLGRAGLLFFLIEIVLPDALKAGSYLWRIAQWWPERVLEWWHPKWREWDPQFLFTHTQLSFTAVFWGSLFLCWNLIFNYNSPI